MRMTIEEFNVFIGDLKKQHDFKVDFLAAVFNANKTFLPEMPKSQRINYVQDNPLNRVLSTIPSEIETRFVIIDYNSAEKETVLIPTELLVGSSWAFTGVLEDGKPYADKLASLYLAEDPKVITRVPVFKIGDKYYTDDGNHRIYASYLKGRPVWANIIGTMEELITD